MHIKRVNKFLIGLFILILIVLGVFFLFHNLIQQTNTPEEQFDYMLEKPDDYENRDSFDVRELEDQIKEYWDYFRKNEEKKVTKINILSQQAGEWIKEGEYNIGKDIPEGLYLCKKTIESKDKSNPNLMIKRKGSNDVRNQDYYVFKLMVYTQLDKGDVIVINENTEIIHVDQFLDNQINQEGIFYEGAYKVGKELPEGQYFILSMDTDTGGARVFNERNQLRASVSRFGYISIDNDVAINLDDCILIPIKKKPVIHPVKYQGSGEGKGKMVFPPGMYKIGSDIPIGTYKIKNEVFSNITELSYNGYHGNETYSPGYWNWCGIMSGNEEQAKNLGWRKIEIDSHLNKKQRFIKITDFKNKISYQMFKGLPTISFTEQDIGNDVNVIRCILIPES